MNQILIICLIGFILLYYLYRAATGTSPSIDAVLVICSRCIQATVGIVLILLHFHPSLVGWLLQNSIASTIAGLLILTAAIQALWKTNSKK